MKLPSPLSAAIEQLADKIMGKDWRLYSTLLEHWKEIVGNEYAEVSSPAKIVPIPFGTTERDKKFPGAGVLHIKIPKGLALEFSFLTEQIMQRVNGFFGYKAIERIVFEPSYGSESPYSYNEKEQKQASREEDLSEKISKISGIEDRELLLSLKSLGSAILKVNNSNNE